MAETKTKKTTTKTASKSASSKAKTSTKKEETKEEVKEIVEVKEEIKKEVKEEVKPIEGDQTKLYLTIDTPYLDQPNQFCNVAGIFPKGRLCYVEEEIDNEEKGQFWKVGKNKYINKLWDGIEVLT